MTDADISEPDTDLDEQTVSDLRTRHGIVLPEWQPEWPKGSLSVDREDHVLAAEVGYTKADTIAALRQARASGGSPRLFKLEPASVMFFERWSEPVRLRLRHRNDGAYELVARLCAEVEQP